MQRAFDILRASGSLLTADELAKRMKVDLSVAQSALERLQRAKKLTSVCQDRTWRYGVKPSAERPGERGTYRRGLLLVRDRA